MKKILAVILFLVSWPIVSIGGPVINVPETHWDYGNVPPNSVLSHDYWIKNKGGDTLRIFEVKPGCGCTLAPIQKRVLAPGDSTVVALVFNTRTSKGNVTKNAKITSNDSTQSSINIDFSANIVYDPDTLSAVRLTPPKMIFNKDTTKFAIVVENHDTSQVKLAMIGQAADDIKIKMKDDVIKGGKTTKLEFEWKGDTLPEYEVNYVLSFDTGMKRLPRFSIPYTIRGTKGPMPGTKPEHAAPLTTKPPMNGSQPPITNGQAAKPTSGQSNTPHGNDLTRQYSPDSVKVEKPLPGASQWPPK